MTDLPSAYASAVAALSNACLLIGSEVPRWTQGAGGNVSQKIGESLWIKASGCRLEQVGQAPHTLARVELAALRAHFLEDSHRALEACASAEQAYAEALASLSDPAFGRASMESGFHALLPRPFVAHFHALSALVMACVAKAQPSRWAQLCRAHGVAQPALLEYVPPGLMLSCAVAALPDFEICLLTNHGVILHADGPEVLQRWAAFERAFCETWQLEALAYSGMNLSLQAHACGPWKILFPDAAVFCDRVAALAQPLHNGQWQMDADAMNLDPAAAELWIATQVLQRAWPNIVELSAEAAQALTRLPTERWRQQQHMPA